MEKSYTSLLCDISELHDLFAASTSLDSFLNKIVHLVSAHMHAEVCSIYLFFEETQELVLSATKGLSEESIHNVRLKLTEGLTGLALQELRPICVKEASQDAHYKYFPGIGEEDYESFLAVPIARGLKRIGVLVVQNKRRDFFNDDDVRVFKAISSQLAQVIETTKMLSTLHRDHGAKVERANEPLPPYLKGKAAAGGIVVGRAFVWTQEEIFENPKTAEGLAAKTSSDLERALEKTALQLEEIENTIREKSPELSLIFTAQLLMLKDPEFTKELERETIAATSPVVALKRVIERYVARFTSISDAYISERAEDVKDLGRRLLYNLLEKDVDSDIQPEEIIIARDLLPSDVLRLSYENTKGIILLSGGTSSHLAILCRSLQTALIICDDQRLLTLPPKTTILMDAEIGNVFINPTDLILSKFAEQQKAKAEATRLSQTASGSPKTTDGVTVDLYANINLLSDATVAGQMHASGVGLYRTEFPFLIRGDFPSEEEQFVIYKKLVSLLPDKEITIRTLDIGGDKVLSYYDSGKENNPFLGIRSIRFSLKHKEIFHQQIRAILRAGAEAKVRMMFPMISSLDEFLEAKKEVALCQQSLESAGIPHNKQVPLGVMIELPSVLEIIDELAEAADFFSIGTNDFIQYLLAVDRTNEKVADLYLPYHPSVLRAIKKVIVAAVAAGKEVSVCGDMAHEEKFIPLLLGMGVRKLSIDPFFLPRTRQLILSRNLGADEAMVAEVLKAKEIKTIAEILGLEK